MGVNPSKNQPTQSPNPRPPRTKNPLPLRGRVRVGVNVPYPKPPTRRRNPPNPKIPHSNPLTNPKPTFYNNPNAKTSFPRTALNGGNNGVKSRPG